MLHDVIASRMKEALVRKHRLEIRRTIARFTNASMTQRLGTTDRITFSSIFDAVRKAKAPYLDPRAFFSRRTCHRELPVVRSQHRNLNLPKFADTVAGSPMLKRPYSDTHLVSLVSLVKIRIDVEDGG